MKFNEVIHGSECEYPRLKTVFDQQLLEEWPEMICYATREIYGVLPGLRVGEHIAHDKLVKT